MNTSEMIMVLLGVLIIGGGVFLAVRENLR